MTEYEKMLAGLAHQPYDVELKGIRVETKEKLFDYNQVLRPSQKSEKTALLKTLLGQADDTTHINPPFHCDYGRNIRVGKNFFANMNCVMLDSGGITIGDNVMFAPNVSLYTVGHPLDPELRNAAWEHGAPIVIGDNVWLGGNVVVLPGATIGANTVVGAGAVVTKDLPPNVLAVGNPCRVVREITEQDRHDYIAKFKPDL